MAARTGNLLCSACGSEQCTMYCTCATAPVYLCDACFMPHRNKNPRLVHTMVPVEVRDISQYQTRCKALAEGREELLQNLTRIDQCCAEVSAVVDTLIIRAQEFRNQFLTQMQGWKEQVSREIYTSLAEVEGSLEQENVQLQSSYSAGIRNYTPGCLTFFKFRVESNTIDTFLQSLLTTECTQPENRADKCLFCVANKEIQTFNTATLQTGPSIPLSKQITRHLDKRFVELEADKLVVCGGPDDVKSAYLLHIRTGQVEDLPDMAYEHCSPGIIVYCGNVHVFGSYHDSGGNRCEQLRLNPSAWSALPNMKKKRCYFTPALWKSAVYLCGGHKNTTVEVFNGISIELLNSTLPDSEATLACVQGDRLLVLSDSYFTALSTLISANAIQATTKARKKSKISSQAQPVLLGKVIFQFRNGQVSRYSVEDGSEIE